MAVVITGNNTPTAGGVTYGDGTTYANTAAGSSGQSLLSAGSSAPTWGTPASATTATNLAGGSNGTIPYQSAAGTTQMLAVGSSGQVLQTNGAGAPSWVTPSAGAMTLISTQTASTSATLQWTGLSGYSRYFLVMTNLIPTTNNPEMRISVGTGATPTYGSVYSWVYAQIINSGLNSNSSASSNNVTITNSNKNTATYADTTGLSGEIVIVNANGGYTTISGRFIGNPNSSTGVDIMTGTFGGSAQDNTARTAVRLLFSSGNILSGSATLYGLS